jgi:hypothetical protein
LAIRMSTVFKVPFPEHQATYAKATRPADRKHSRGALERCAHRAGRIGQNVRGGNAVNGVEQERLKQAVERLIDAQLEALDVIAERSEPNVEDLEEDDQALVGVHLEAALEEVRAILEGAQEDVRGILGGEGVAS